MQQSNYSNVSGTNSSYDDELEAGFRHIRQVLSRKLGSRETEITAYQNEITKRDLRIEELQKVIIQLESELNKTNKKISDLGVTVGKLSNFKQMIVETLDVDDLSEIQKRFSGVTSGTRDRDPLWATNYNGQQQQHQQKAKSSMISSSFVNNNIEVSRSPFSLNSHIPASSLYNNHAENNNQTFDGSAYGAAANGHQYHPFVKSNNQDIFKVEPPIPASLRQSHNPLKVSSSPVPPPPPSKVPMAIDGRQFFRRARSQLPYDKFTLLLQNVKSYNAREQTRLATLKSVSLFLKPDFQELYRAFEQLMSVA